jgi:aminopeptidase N
MHPASPHLPSAPKWLALLLWGALSLLLASCTFLQSHLDRIRPPKLGNGPTEFSRQDSLTGSLGPFRRCYDVTFYDLDIEVDVADRAVRGLVGIRFVMLEDADSLQLDLYRNMEIHTIEFEHRTVLFRREHNSVFLDPRHLRKGESGTLWVSYSGHPLQATQAPWSGGFVWKKDRSGFDYVALTTEKLGPSFWWPNKDHPSDEADSLSIRITAPSELTAVSNGLLRSQRILDDTRTTWHWYVSNPINTGNVSLNLGNYVNFYDTLQTSEGVRRLDYYVLPHNYGRARKHFQQTKRILRTFESLFGPYPWWDDGYKVVEAPFVGMEHQSAIAYGNGFSNESNYFTFGAVDYILLHETAHEWWGNSVTACDAAEQWLHEGFATYAEALYIERTLGKARALDYLQEDKRRIRDRQPLVGPCEVGWTHCDGDIYTKGAWVLHTMRGVINDDEVFFDILHTFALRNRGKVVCTSDFQALVEEKTHQDFSAFFHQYLYRSEPPTLEYYYDRTHLFFRWTHVAADFEMPVDMIVNLKPSRIYPNFQVSSIPLAKATKVVPDMGRFYLRAVINPALAESPKMQTKMGSNASQRPLR